MRLLSSALLLGVLATCFAGCSSDDDPTHPDAGPDERRAPTLVIQPRGFNLDEGAAERFTIALESAPAGPVTLQLRAPAGLRVEPEALTFDAASWSRAQTVTVTSLADGDREDDIHEVALFANGVVIATVRVGVADKDKVAPSLVVLEPASFVLSEGATDTLSIHLKAPPKDDTAAVTLTPASPARVTVSKLMLTFTRDDWQLPKTVRLEALRDANAIAENTSIDVVAVVDGHSSTERIQVTVPDVDTQRVVVPTDSVVVIEGRSATVNVRLAAEPTGPVALDVKSASDKVATVTPPRLTFDQRDWNQPHAVTITGALDADNQKATTTIALAGGGLSASIAVDVYDTGTVAIVGPAAISVDEGKSKEATIRLDRAPTSEVIVTLLLLDDEVAAITPATLTFTPTDWSTPKPFTVSAPADGDVSDAVTTFEAAATGLLPARATLTAVDDKRLNLDVTPTSLLIDEGTTGTFQVALKDRPSVDTEVKVTSSDDTAAWVRDEYLTFTPRNFAAPQDVRIKAVHDIDLDSESVQISLSAAGKVQSTVRVDVTDKDLGEIVVSDSNLALREGGDAEVIDVTLGEAPTREVVVSLTVAGTGDVVASPSTLRFTPTDWNMPHRVTVTARVDDDLENSKTVITLASDGYKPEPVEVNARDQDELALDLSADKVTVVEDASFDVTVRLSHRPRADVVVTVKSIDTNVATVSTGSLTFPRDRWNVGQTLTIRGVRDPDAREDDTRIRLTSPGQVPGRTIEVIVPEAP